MVASLTVLANAAEEGARIVLGMLVVGLIFLAIVLLGDGLHYLSHKRQQAKAGRPL